GRQCLRGPQFTTSPVCIPGPGPVIVTAFRCPQNPFDNTRTDERPKASGGRRLTPRNQRRLGVLVGITLLLSLLGAASAAGSPIQDKQAEAARIQAQLDSQGNKISQLDEQYNRAQMNVASTQATYAKAQADLAAANA